MRKSILPLTILEEKSTEPQESWDPPLPTERGNVPLVITTVGLIQPPEKLLQEKPLVARLCNHSPGTILPERQSAQLVLLHINHTKPAKAEASGEHRKQNKTSISPPPPHLIK